MGRNSASVADAGLCERGGLHSHPALLTQSKQAAPHLQAAHEPLGVHGVGGIGDQQAISGVVEAGAQLHALHARLDGLRHGAVAQAGVGVQVQAGVILQPVEQAVDVGHAAVQPGRERRLGQAGQRR